MHKNVIKYFDLGVIPYRTAWEFQESLQSKRQEGETEDTIIFCEHPPVFTVGKQECSEDWLSASELIERDNIEIVNCNRGGRITYHGPGQLVVYFIVDIKNYSEGVKDFVSLVERTCLDALFYVGVKGDLNENHPGIWIGKKKIVAIGFNISRGISMHGIAMNVNPEMAHYRHIVPCGIKNMGVTSLAEEMKKKSVGMEKAKFAFLEAIEKNFHSRLKKTAKLT